MQKEKDRAATTKQPAERPAAAEDRARDQGDREPPRAPKQEEGAVPEESVGKERRGTAETPKTEAAATEGDSRGQDSFARFDGIMVERQVRIAETGEVATLRFDAGRALRELDQRQRAVEQLRACVARGGA